MKKWFLVSIIVLNQFYGFTQEVDLKSNFSISVVTYNDHLKDLNNGQIQKLESKLLQMVSNYGISGVDYSDRFVLYPDFRVDEYKVIENTTRNIHIVRGEFTVFVKDTRSNKLFGSHTTPVEGNGRSKDAALLKTISSLKTQNISVEKFLEGVKEKIVESYRTNCSTIQNQSEISLANGDYESVIKQLSNFPLELVTEDCFSEILRYLKLANRKLINRDCSKAIILAKKEISSENPDLAFQFLSDIDQESKCSSEAKDLIGVIYPSGLPDVPPITEPVVTQNESLNTILDDLEDSVAAYIELNEMNMAQMASEKIIKK